MGRKNQFLKTRQLLFLIIAILLVPCASGCSDKTAEWEPQSISLYAEEITREGLILNCLYDAGNTEIQVYTWIPYWLEYWNGTAWESLDTHLGDHPASMWSVLSGVKQSWSIDWSDSVGSLEPGLYRIGKEFTIYEQNDELCEMILYEPFIVE
ncbi:MAG: hypothetical protein IJP11_02330 [Oscillospiraceae bacterium]|nr:hypothetical protein [Oscillospiraceae bacterium]